MTDNLFQLKKINDEEVTAIKVPKYSKKNVLGFDLFPELYSNIFICAKKKSGKTSVIFKILKECASKDTKIIAFCTTHKKDANWIAIKEYLDKKDIPNMFFGSMEEEGVHILDQIVKKLEQNSNDEEKKKEEVPPEEPKIINFSEDKKYIRIKIKKPKPKVIAPEYIFIFDDFSTELRDKVLAHLVKTNRHPKSKVIISSQYPNDLRPDCRKQMDVWIVFKGHSKDKLEAIHQNTDTNIPYDIFESLYQDATAQPYNFLYIDTNNDKYRKNFNLQYNL